MHRFAGGTMNIRNGVIFFVLMSLLACSSASHEIYKDQNMDFGAIETVAVLPLSNLTRDQYAAERVRDVFTTMLLSTGNIYVIPPGEVARGIARAGITDPTAPSTEDLVKLAGIIKANAIITGVVREYGEVRSGTTSANVVSLSMQMVEAQTGRVIWSASSTQGGIGMGDRLFGGGGKPLNDVTEKAINDIIDKLYR